MLMTSKKWKTVQCVTPAGADGVISLEVKRLNAYESGPLFRVIREIFSDLPKDGTNMIQNSRMLEAIGKDVSDDGPASVMQDVFTKYIRNVQGLVVDDEPITTGEELFGVADETLFSQVVDHLRKRATLTAAQGKASPSPSISGSAAAGEPASSSPGPGTSPVVPASSEVGTDQETVPATPEALKSSSEPA